MEQLNTINEKQEILNNFKLLYHCLKFKIKLRNWLWIYVREPKIQKLCHPSLLLNHILENTTDSFGKTIFN